MERLNSNSDNSISHPLDRRPCAADDALRSDACKKRGGLIEPFLAEEAAVRRSLDSLRGIEGQAAAVYFPGFGKALRRNLQFTKRTRRPPRDPVNALLGFGYTLLYGEAIAALSTVGFDPYLGFLHSFHYGRCSLALDLMEEFRPLIVDRLVLKIINLEVVKPDDFETDPNTGVNLKPGARKRFFREYETVMCDPFTGRVAGEQTSLRRGLHQQAQALQRAVIEGSTYSPFRPRGGENKDQRSEVRGQRFETRDQLLTPDS